MDMNPSTRKELETFFRALVGIARWTLLEVDKRMTALLTAHYGSDKGKGQIEMLRLLAESASGLSVVEVGKIGAVSLVLVRNRAVDVVHSPQGRAFCLRMADLLDCPHSSCTVRDLPTTTTASTSLNAAKRISVLPVQFNDRQSGKSVESRMKYVGQHGGSKRVLLPIPSLVCGKGNIIEKVGGCGEERSSSLWTYENDGWFKCRNETHWLSSCQRISVN